jgi:hypothetical protein
MTQKSIHVPSPLFSMTIAGSCAMNVRGTDHDRGSAGLVLVE